MSLEFRPGGMRRGCDFALLVSLAHNLPAGGLRAATSICLSLKTSLMPACLSPGCLLEQGLQISTGVEALQDDAAQPAAVPDRRELAVVLDLVRRPPLVLERPFRVGVGGGRVAPLVCGRNME